MAIGKRGQEDESAGLAETIIFFVLNILFFAVMLYFTYSAGSSSAIYEEIYSKQIALMIDRAEPGMIMKLDISDLIKNAKDRDEASLVKINSNRVSVTLRASGGYGYKYFSDYKVDSKVSGNYLIMEVKEK